MRVFPAKNSIRKVPIFTAPPPRDERESDQDFERRSQAFESLRDIRADVRMLGRSEAVRLQHARASLTFEFRMSQLLPVEEQRPIPFEWIERWREVNREIVKATLVGLPGAKVGDVELERGLSPEELVELVDQTGLLVEVAAACLEAQNPTREERDFLGS